MSGVVTVWSRWGDYVLAVDDVYPGNSGRALVSFVGGVPRVGDRELSRNEPLRFTRDGLDYEAIWSELPVPPRNRPWSLLGGTTLAIGIALGAMLLAPTYLKHLARPEPRNLATPEARYLAVDVAPMEHETQFAVAPVPQTQLERVSGTTRCGDAKMGRPYTDPVAARYGLRGPADNPDPHLARPELDPGYAGGEARPAHGFGAASSWVPGSLGPTAPWGRDTAGGIEARDATGNMWGEHVGESDGEAGLGRRGVPGGLAKRLDVAAFVSAPGELRLIHTGLRIDGARKPSEIGRALSSRFEGFRGCANVAAGARTVELSFEVKPDGSVRATRGSDALEQCLNGVVHAIAFAPGAAARVTYPLHFVPATTEVRPSSPRAPKPEKCNCG